MEIKNKFVKLKIGKKEFEFRNLILNSMLDLYANRFVSNNFWSNIISGCFIRLDTPLSFDETSTFQTSDFNLILTPNEEMFENKNIYNPTGVTLNYKFTGDPLTADISSYRKWSEYAGRKITAIGFSRVSLAPAIVAMLDVSSLNLVIGEEQDITITRVDEVSSNGIMSTSSPEIKGLIHLGASMPAILPRTKLVSLSGTSSVTSYDFAFPKLTAIGLGFTPSRISKRYGLTELSITKTGLGEVTIAGMNAPEGTRGLFPGTNTLPGANTFPARPNYKYVIYEYKIFQTLFVGTYENYTEVETDTGEYYYQAFPLEKIDDLTVKIKYERSN